jgi:hypothetical protein
MLVLLTIELLKLASELALEMSKLALGFQAQFGNNVRMSRPFLTGAERYTVRRCCFKRSCAQVLSMSQVINLLSCTVPLYVACKYLPITKCGVD